MIVPIRGRVYYADIGEPYGEKPYLVVSNNGRNSRLDSCLAVRITTSPKPALQTIVELSPADPLVGRILCDDLLALYREELRRDVGGLTPDTMLHVATALRHALAL